MPSTSPVVSSPAQLTSAWAEQVGKCQLTGYSRPATSSHQHRRPLSGSEWGSVGEPPSGTSTATRPLLQPPERHPQLVMSLQTAPPSESTIRSRPTRLLWLTVFGDRGAGSGRRLAGAGTRTGKVHLTRPLWQKRQRGAMPGAHNPEVSMIKRSDI